MDVCEAPYFVAASDEGWTQINITLACDSGSLRDAAWPLFDGLERWLATARQQGTLACWFVRKPPGLRLRLRGPGFDAAARDELAGLLHAQQGAGPIVQWGRTTYEPEVHRLGGPVALELVHSLLAGSTDVWLAWERLSRSGQAQLAAELMALSLYDDLLARSFQAREESWDVWVTLSTIYEPTLGPLAPRGTGEPRVLAPRALFLLASPQEQALLERGHAAATAFASGLAHAHDGCTLAGGRRSLVGTLASFLFNLWGLRPATVAGLCRLAVRELDPRIHVPRHASQEHAR